MKISSNFVAFLENITFNMIDLVPVFDPNMNLHLTREKWQQMLSQIILLLSSLDFV